MVSPAIDTCEVHLWGHTIGAAYWDTSAGIAAFEYEPSFQGSRVELAPLRMPLGPRIYRFPELRQTSFRGLPGLLADSLPDDFGNALINQWLLREGRELSDFSPIERLCYIGQRGMGALEFRPSMRRPGKGSVPIDVSALTELAQQVLERQWQARGHVDLNEKADDGALDDILRVGTSAGGARAKAVVAWNPGTGEMRSGQLRAPEGFEYWILKFDGVSNREHGLQDPAGYGRIEFAYYLMATSVGIDMNECRLLEEGGRSHFMTRRFDRMPDGEKVHMQSMYALAHLDNQLAGAHSYEQVFDALLRLRAPMSDAGQQFRRMAFNVVARNQDDHTKNVAFLMDKQGNWRLSPAFDVIYAYNPDGAWTSSHQMTINGKRNAIGRDDLMKVAGQFRIRDAKRAIDEVLAGVRQWPDFASQAGVPADTAERIAKTHRLLDKSG